MKYRLSSPSEIAKAYADLQKLVEGKKVVDIKEVKPRRSLNQNAYLHLLLGAFGSHFGYTLEESKAIYKQLNSSIYEYTREVRGKTHTFYRSSADLTKEEMQRSIDTLHEWSAKAGYPLPPADNPEWIQSVENMIEQHNRYL